ncbi:unnamed protein product [Oppiella nova]|uniref:TPX2 central domain-containing protein n=1 Tax=Oppiella nova TaxID=334625 RepID=A0A7R9QG96_9ACAR|nr:unnamed protein product [Oppiella nova]CAG2165132.1 unnamed protein product [Oppiella nova]
MKPFVKSSDCVDTADDAKEWEYMCPQFCDLTAVETMDQLKQMDHFFELDHEMSPQMGGQHNKTLINEFKEPLVEDKDKEIFRYETPPQNKENLEDDEELFYSTKKYLSVEKRISYKLRSTPMRTLQYNGATPLRESRISSKKRYTKSKTPKDEDIFKMDELAESLPTETAVVVSHESYECQLPAQQLQSEVTPDAEDDAQYEDYVEIQSEDHNEVDSEVQNEVQIEVHVESPTDDPIDDHNSEDAIENEVFDSNEKELTEAAPNVTLTGRESYVIEKKAPTRQKSVTLVSPDESARNPPPKSSKRKGTPLRKSILSSHRKGTPIHKSILSSRSMVSRPRTSEVVSRLYSTAKKKATNTYKTMAELLKEFETKPRSCDHRSHSTERKAVAPAGTGMGSRSSSTSSLTRPKSPKLHSMLRHRRTPRPTEDIIASEIKKYSFKANPIRKKLFDAKFASGIPRVKSIKEPTKAVEMHFQTEVRNQMRAVKTTDDKSAKQPKALPFKAHPMPEFKTFKAQPKSERKPTTFKPFSFDHQIQNLVHKKRTLSEDLNYMKPSVVGKPFKF